MLKTVMQWIKWKPFQIKFTPQNCHAYFALLKIDWHFTFKRNGTQWLSEKQYNSSLLHKIVMLISLCLKLTDIYI